MNYPALTMALGAAIFAWGLYCKIWPAAGPMVASGDVDGTMLEALEDYVKRLKKRLGIEPNKKEAAN